MAKINNKSKNNINRTNMSSKNSRNKETHATPIKPAATAALKCIKTTTITTTATTKTIHRKQRNIRWQQPLRITCAGIEKSLFMMLAMFLLFLTIETIHATDITQEQQQQQQSHRIEAARMPTTTPTTTAKYSQPLTLGNNDSDSFRPIIPKDINPEYISRNVFTETGQYRVFQPINSDLRVGVATTSVVQQQKQQQQRLQQYKDHNHNDNNKVGVIEEKLLKEEITIEKTKATQTQTQTEQKVATSTKGNKPMEGNIKTTEASAASAARDNRQSSEQRQQQQHGLSNDLPHKIIINHHLPPKHKSLITATSPYRLSSSLPLSPPSPSAPAVNFNNTINTEMKALEDLLVEYVENFFNKGQYQPLPGLVFELQKNRTDPLEAGELHYPTNNKKRRHAIGGGKADDLPEAAAADSSISINIPRALESGRLLFFTGLKKIMWPIWMGLNILKSLLFAMFLPTLIGSFGKLLGKGIISGSAPLFIRPADTPQDLDFRDNTFNFDDDSKFGMTDEPTKDDGYAYNHPEASQQHNQYLYNAAAINQQALSRYGMNEQQKMPDSYLSALQSISSASFKNSNSISGSSSAGGLGGGGSGGQGAPMRTKPAAPANINTFQTFQKVPASSLLLSNYDPFYSPLLSRLDSVFAQLKLNSENEDCREKVICLMYASPAKYAPYSNLVSAQLSRELNELRKPTSDNEDILRFFKYMRAAKDGQDGVDCEKSFDRCKEFKDFENPAMVSTYHDINKLVQARKMT